MKKRLVTVMLVLGLLLVPAATASAQPVVEEEPAFAIFFDDDHDLVVFVNITRDDFCDWWFSDREDPPPVTNLVPIRFIETGQGAIVASFDTQTYIELWQSDVPEAGPGPCEDTEGQEGPWATGTVRWSARDNDIDVSLTRRNVFGDRLQATVPDVDGNRWRYNLFFRAQVTRDGEFIPRVLRTSLRPA